MKEVNIAVRKFKLSKSPGVDGFRSEMLKYGGEVIADILMTVCQVAWRVGKVPNH